MNLYTIIFEDNSIFLGGDLKNTKWLEIPNKKIRTIFYALPLGDCIGLSEYDKYYHYVEVCEDLNGDKKGETQLEYTYLIGKKGTTYKMYKISLRTGQVEVTILEEKDKMIQQLNPIGWK